ncbi:MAG: extracellular solute-binding protein [Cellvibrionales bacterium]|nr:extracellular solute-binding protein [Cellvibrionales bacterium]
MTARYLSLLASLFIALAVIAFIARTPPPADDCTPIEFWTMQLSPVLDDYLNQAIADYEQLNPHIKIKWVDVAWADMERKLLAAVAANTAPDIANLNPQFSSKLAEFAALHNPEQFMAQTAIANYFPKVWQANQLHGQIFGVPWYLSTNIAIYNRALFTAANAPFPQTLADIPAIGRQIKQATGAYSFFPSFDGSELLENHVLLGGQFTPADNRLHPADVRRTLAYYRDLYQSGAVPPSVLIDGHQKALDLFQSGQLAILLSGAHMLHSIMLNAPKLADQITVGPHPKSANDTVNIAAMNLVVPRQSDHPQKAFDFVAFITSPARQAEMATHVPVFPSTPASLNAPIFTNADPDNPQYEQAKAYSIAQLKKGEVLLPPMQRYSKLNTVFARQTQRVMLEEISLTEGTTKLIADWNKITRASHD